MAVFYRPPENCQIPNLGGKWEALFGRLTAGTFVEVGAYDGENYSNTSCLADTGWSGLYIEPIAEFAQRCRERHAANSKVQIVECAVSDAAGEIEVHLGDTLTTIVGPQVVDYEQIDWAKGLHQGNTRRVRMERLDAILDREGIKPGFEVLSVDVEGAEFQVFSGFDIGRWRPKSVVVELEDDHPDFKDNERVVANVRRVRAILEGAGYRAYYRDIINTIYVDGSIYPSLPPEVVVDVPRVTVAIPTYNGQRTISRSLESVAAQTYRNFRLVISDNVSNDHTASYIQTYAPRFESVQVLRRAEKVDVITNFSEMLSNATTEYFVWLADDDWWEPTFLEECVQALDANRDAQTAFTGFRVYYHYLDRYSDVMSYTPSMSGDARLNVLARADNMAPCAFYGLHRTPAIARAMRDVVGPFDFHDVAVTAHIATQGQMIVIDKDLYRAGVRDMEAVARRSITGGRIRYVPFAKALAAICRRKFGWNSTLAMMPKLLLSIYKVKRHHSKSRRAGIRCAGPESIARAR